MRTKQEAIWAVKYGAVGVLNTAITAIVYYVLRKLDVGVDLANLVSYEVGFVNSYVWNRLWVFRSHRHDWQREGVTFWVGAHLCWGIQWGVFRGLLSVVPEAWSYAVSMCVYPVLNYFYNRLITFKKNKCS